MKKERINIWKNRKHPVEPNSPTLNLLVMEMVQFFNGFEYDDTAIVMAYHDYCVHKNEFTDSGRSLKLAGYPVYFDGILQHGHILLTTVEAAEKLQNDSETSAC